MPDTEYWVVNEGCTEQLLAEALQPELLQLYEVAAGVQLAVRVDDAPGVMYAGDAVRVHTGGPVTALVVAKI